MLHDRYHTSHNNWYKQLGGRDGCHEGYPRKAYLESEEKEACIRLQEEKIVRLTRKLEKCIARSFTKSSKSEA